MSQSPRSVFEAIERWQAKSLVTPEQAHRLREETVLAAERGTARLTQYLVAAAGAVVLLLACGVFLEWAWPRWDESTRTGFLVGVGIGVHLWGVRLEAVRRWIPASLFLQTAGLGLLTAAYLYSDNAWADATPGAIGIGIAALATPLLLAPRSFRANVVMPSVHLCFALAFVAIGLDRATVLSGDAIIWVVDGILVVAAAAMVLVLRRDPAGVRHPWALNAFVAAVYASAILVVLTAAEPLGLEKEVAYALDVWLLLVAGLTLWGIHRSPPGLRRDWFENQLAYCVLLWIPLGFFTAMETLDGPSELALALVGGVAVAGFSYALRYRVRRVLGASAVAFVAAAWVWAADRAGALGVVVGLALAAAILFWLSGRVGAWAGDAEGGQG